MWPVMDRQVSAGGIVVVEIGPDRLDELHDLWLALHRHHVRIGSWPLVSDEAAAWVRRRAQYEEWLRAGDGVVLMAERAGRPAGYAVVHLQRGPDDTFPLGDRWAEIYSLSVAPDARGEGIGGRLLDAIDERLAALGIVDVAVAAMVENEDALRWYQRRGFVPREVVLYRFGEQP
jgi:ribosomal protein S18 acetylase RimI-like enzyme